MSEETNYTIFFLIKQFLIIWKLCYRSWDKRAFFKTMLWLKYWLSTVCNSKQKVMTFFVMTFKIKSDDIFFYLQNDYEKNYRI